MFKTRLLSGILLVIIALITVISGGEILFVVVLHYQSDRNDGIVSRYFRCKKNALGVVRICLCGRIMPYCM